MDYTAIIVACISFFGTSIGSVIGILTSSKLSNYRISQLEEKVNKHNNLIERMVAVENRSKSNTHRLDELEERLYK